MFPSHVGGPGTPALFDSDQDVEPLGLPNNSSVCSLSGLVTDFPEWTGTASPRAGTSPTFSKTYAVKARGEGTVLVVDDSPVARKLLAIQVERVTGYRCQAAASGADALTLLAMIEESGGNTFDAILVDYAMIHHTSLTEGRERVSLDGPDTAIAIRQSGYKGRIIGMCGSTGGYCGGSRLDFQMRGGVVLVLKKPLNSHQLKEAILDTAEESVISLRFIQKRYIYVLLCSPLYFECFLLFLAYVCPPPVIVCLIYSFHFVYLF